MSPKLAEALVTQQHRAIIEPVANDTPDGLIDSAGCLLRVPRVPRKSSARLLLLMLLPRTLIEVFTLEFDARIFGRCIRQACDHNSAAIVVREINALADFAAAHGKECSATKSAAPAARISRGVTPISEGAHRVLECDCAFRS